MATERNFNFKTELFHKFIRIPTVFNLLDFISFFFRKRLINEYFIIKRNNRYKIVILFAISFYTLFHRRERFQITMET